jgi:uncharacterized membrane protein
MTDPVDPIPATSASPPPLPSDFDTKTGTTGLPSNVAAALACIPLVGGLIFYILEKRDNFVRFYAMQSILFGVAWIFFMIVYQIAYFLLAHIPGIGFLFAILLWSVWLLASLAFLVILIVTIVKAYSGVHWDIPYVGPMARKQMGEPTV